MAPRSSPGRSDSRKSGARWSLLIITFFLLSTAAQQCKVLTPSRNVELAMAGYDPLMTNVMEQPDPGRKLRLFTAKQRNSLYDQTKKDVLNAFVDEVQQSRCSPSFTEAVVQNYEEYKSLTSAAISFSTEADATTPLGATQFNFKEKAGYGNQHTPNEIFIRDFFNGSQREARLVKAECVTHTVSILPFHEAVFTPAFESALYALHLAAVDTNSETRKRVFSQFVRSYGTHFARTTHFGYAAYFVKLFRAQAKTSAEEAVRRRCVLESARETLAPGGQREFESIDQHFSRVVASKCGEEEVDELVTETGSASVSGAEGCVLCGEEEVDELVTETGSASVSGTEGCVLGAETPRPVAYILEKISALFDETWIRSKTLQTRQVRLNVTALSAYFEDQLGEYSQDVVDKAETPSKKQCFWSRPITLGTTAGPPSTTAGPPSTNAEPSEATSQDVTGRIIIVGGPSREAPYSVALFGPALPPFPIHVFGNTLSRAGGRVYSCGGDSSKNKCWVIDTGRKDAAWRSFVIPWELAYHSAVVVQEEIWFFLNSKLRILNLSNPANKSREIDLEFSFTKENCAVSHGSKTFVIGVGKGGGEVYVNTDNSKPEQWERFSTLLQGRRGFGCLVFGREIFVTGGLNADSGRDTSLSSVEAISVVDGTVRCLVHMGRGRSSHQMAVIDGRLAVLGGSWSDMESYNVQNNSWETLGYSLGAPRYNFGLTQFLP